MTIVVLAEKPSMARDIAAAIGATRRGKGYLEGGGYKVTWAVGHLVRLAEPHEANKAWRRWTREALPLVPDRWPLVVASDDVKAQFNIVKGLLKARETKKVVVATDAGREGELIWRYIAEKVGCKKPAVRLWISSLTKDAIREGFRNLKPASEFDGLADAAVCRSRADWLVGMNLTRLHTLEAGIKGQTYSVGRVQTPTLAMVVHRDRQIQDFVPSKFGEVFARFGSPEGEVKAAFVWRGYTESGKPCWSPRLGLGLEGEPEASADELAERARAGTAIVKTVNRERSHRLAPLLYDLTELQKSANTIFGFSASRTLELAQTLYEKHKVLSYPRTDCKALSATVAEELPSVIAALPARYEELKPPGAGTTPLPRRFVNDAKVTEHHALIPTTANAGGIDPASDEGKIYDLVVRRLLSAWAPDLVEAQVEMVVMVEHGAGTDRYEAKGRSVESPGWKALQIRRGAETSGEQIPAGLHGGQALEVLGVETAQKQTQPPKSFTEASLLGSMENSSRQVDDPEAAAALKERGLGTPATRAAVIEGLILRGYMVRQGKAVRATSKGGDLIAKVHPRVRSPKMTGEWERKLRAVEQGGLSLSEFMREVEDFVAEVVPDVTESAGLP